MRKITLLLSALFFTVAANAQTQETETTTKKDAVFNWYVGFGAVVNPDYAINDNLREAGIHRIADVMPSLTLGWTATTDKLDVDMEFGAAGIIKDKKGNGYQMAQVPILLRIQYAAIKKEKLALMGGLSCSYVMSNLSIFSNDTNVDMNDLNPMNNSGYIMLRNNSMFLGPSVSLKLFDESKLAMKVNMGYDFAVSNTRWKSDYANIQNPVRENGNRFYVNLVLPLGTIWGN
jgi:hypothetical protein